MHVPRLWMMVWVFALLPLAAVRAQVPDGKGDCGGTDEGKSGLCGHALTDMAIIEREGMVGLTSVTPETTDITHALLDFEVITSTNPKTIQGTVTFSITSLVDGLSQVTLEFKANMNVTAVRVNGAAAGFTRPTNQIVIDLGASYNTLDSFTLAVDFNGTPQNRTSSETGFGFNFFDTHGSNKTIASSFSEPFYANWWWPCKESLQDKFTLQTYVTVPNTMVVAANGLLQGTDALSGSRVRYRWQENYPIITYLVSFAATNYSKQTFTYNYTGGSMPVEFYYYPEQIPSTTTLNNIVQAIGVYSSANVYGQYPFVNEKYGIAQFPWCCGMEHQTITSQGDYLTETRNVHELSHHWWGDNVTCKTWHDCWLNEGFARFSEAVWQERKTGGSYAAYLNVLNSNRPSPLVNPDPLIESTVYRYDISTTAKIFSTQYVYNKGGWVLHMLRHVLGDAAFFQALQAYRAAYQGGSAETADLEAAIELSCGKDLAWFFNEWVYSASVPYYRYGWQAQTINGQNYVSVYIQQYQDTLTNPLTLMSMPIDVRVTTAAGAQTFSVSGKAVSQQWFLLPTNGVATAVALDPDTWILRGDASATPYLPAPPKLLAATPAPGQTVAAPVSQIVLRFSSPVTFDPTFFHVYDAAVDFVTFTTQYNAASYTVTLNLATALHTGSWSVTVDQGVQTAGIALDGEIANPPILPSGDGVPGGGAAFKFSIPAPGDFDGDGDVDVLDADHLIGCLAPSVTPPAGGCSDADLDQDGNVDQSDFGLFQRCVSGPVIGPPANCMQ